MEITSNDQVTSLNVMKGKLPLRYVVNFGVLGGTAVGLWQEDVKVYRADINLRIVPNHQ